MRESLEQRETNHALPNVRKPSTFRACPVFAASVFPGTLQRAILAGGMEHGKKPSMSETLQEDRELVFYSVTRERACSYLPDRQEQLVVADVQAAADPRMLNEQLTLAGFRRSHRFAYRPACRGCNACIPVRIPVTGFDASRSQRRIRRRNHDLEVEVKAPLATKEHYDLFCRYQKARHEGGGMSSMDFDDLHAMIGETSADTRLVEARSADGTLVAVSLTDWFSHGLSGVYKFFDPELSSRSLGTWLILWHIAHARKSGLSHVYLGYWIAECSKMSYKTNFRPLEALIGNDWIRYPAERP